MLCCKILIKFLSLYNILLCKLQLNSYFQGKQNRLYTTYLNSNQNIEAFVMYNENLVLCTIFRMMDTLTDRGFSLCILFERRHEKTYTFQPHLKDLLYQDTNKCTKNNDLLLNILKLSNPFILCRFC